MPFNTPPVIPALTNAPLAAPMPSPAQFASTAVSGIASTLGTIAPPLLSLAIVGMGLKTILTGQRPAILGGNKTDTRVA